MTTTADVQPWQENVAANHDERLAGPRDPAWWYTGLRPDHGGCPGVDEAGHISSLPYPDLSTCSRADVVDYFNNTWTLHDVLFAGLDTTEAFYRPPEHGLRHPMVFYYGHTAALYINKLRVAGLLDAPIDEYLEDVLETGVDENSWDDMSKNEMLWPSVARVHAYRLEVYRTVLGVIESMDFAAELGRPLTMDDQAWAIFLGVEHDRIHLETSSVLIREMPLRLLRRPEAWPPPAPGRNTTTNGRPDRDSYPANELVAIPGGPLELGKPRDFPSFGLDNEYGTRQLEVADFEVARCLVSNGEYHEFVADGGYRRPELWSAEGERWRRFRNTKWPRFWVPTGPTGLHSFRLRTTFDEIDLPWNWPVVVNFHESKAFCAWKAEKDGRSYRLPTEGEYFLMRALPSQPDVKDDLVMQYSGTQLREQGVNFNLAWGSEGPVDASTRTLHGVHDAGGNLFSWSEETFNPLDGFAPHPYYEDISVPSFDGLHQMIFGGCFISSGDLASIWSRHFFRPHFLQQAGIRLVAPSVVEDEAAAQQRLADEVLQHLGQFAAARDLLVVAGPAGDDAVRGQLAGSHDLVSSATDPDAGLDVTVWRRR